MYSKFWECRTAGSTEKFGLTLSGIALAIAALATPIAVSAAPVDGDGVAVHPIDGSGGGNAVHATILSPSGSGSSYAQAGTAASSPSLAPSSHSAEPVSVGAAQPGQVVAGGTVPDQGSKDAILSRLRAIYGDANVQDQIEIGDVATPANWSANVQKLLSNDLKGVHKGQLKIDGTQIDVRGEVQNEAQRQQVASDMANVLNPTYTIRNGLRISAAPSEQGLLDQTLANRTIEFEVGSAVLAPEGRTILDQMAGALTKIGNTHVEIIGHTDSSGNRTSNIALSQARADAVKGYLVDKGIPAAQMNAAGVGPDQPIAPNNTSDGRARNRRIEFRAGH